jgi:hypothetical protein
MIPRLGALLLTLLVGLLPGEESPMPAVRQELAAADAARVALATEQADWSQERERQELLIAAFERERQALAGEEGRERGLLEQSASQIALAKELEDDLGRWRSAVAQLAAALRPALEAAERRLPPLDQPPGDDLAGLLTRLQAVEAVDARCTLRLLTGREAGGQERGVKLLSAGRVAAWWLALDASAAGQARFGAEGLELLPAEAALLPAIREAVAILEGRQTASALLLPLGTQP